MGVMGRQDGVDHLLRAVAHLVHELGRTDLLCVVIGRGEAVPSLERLTAELGLERHVWFTGYVTEEELVRYLCTADVCVDPDPSNPFNDRSTMLKMMDYMTLGRPTVAFDLPEHRVTAGDAALYVPANDDAALAVAIDGLMDDPALRERMGALARRRVVERLAWTYSVPHLLAAYDALTAGASGSGERARGDDRAERRGSGEELGQRIGGG
jgi:glycosyltransferase involved in cell wall biosynthesis